MQKESVHITPRMLSARAVCKLTTFSRSTLYLMIGSGEFPRPVKLGKRRVGWREADVFDWLGSRQEADVAA